MTSAIAVDALLFFLMLVCGVGAVLELWRWWDEWREERRGAGREARIAQRYRETETRTS